MPDPENKKELPPGFEGKLAAFIDAQEPVPMDIAEIIDDNFWSLLDA
jgi:hypothetical protein